MIQIKNIQTFSIVQILILDKKKKDASCRPLYILLQAWSSSKLMVQWRTHECFKGLTSRGVSGHVQVLCFVEGVHSM